MLMPRISTEHSTDYQSRDGCNVPGVVRFYGPHCNEAANRLFTLHITNELCRGGRRLRQRPWQIQRRVASMQRGPRDRS